MAPVAQILVVSLAVVTLATVANENQFNALKELVASVQLMGNGALP
jgi:hypothetical protein